jgi:hypothetical protein
MDRLVALILIEPADIRVDAITAERHDGRIGRAEAIPMRKPALATLAVVLPFLFFGSGFSTLALGETTISAADAKDHVGETVTVCGVVASSKYAATTHRQPTFLDFDRPYPNPVFTVVIWGTDRTKFGTPEETYRGKRICVRGTISLYKGRPEIIASDPGQIMASK